ELVGRAATLAHWMEREFPRSGAPVALLGHREPQLLVGMLACALTNRPYVPIDDGLPAPRIKRIQGIAGVIATLTPGDIDRLAPGTSPPPPRGHAGRMTSTTSCSPRGAPANPRGSRSPGETCRRFSPGCSRSMRCARGRKSS